MNMCVTTYTHIHSSALYYVVVANRLKCTVNYAAAMAVQKSAVQAALRKEALQRAVEEERPRCTD